MKLLSRQQVEKLAYVRGDKYLTTSFFLDTDKSRRTKKEILVSAKNLLTLGRSRIEALDPDKERKASLLCDLDKIQEFCGQNAASNSVGLAVFSRHGDKFWQDFHLPHPPRNRIIFEPTPYVRPLFAILGRYRRICVLLIGRRDAKWYNVFMGEISALDSLSSDVPGRVKEGGFEGTESKRIERHIESHLHDHFKVAAQRTFELFKKHQFDWLFLSCEESIHSDFEPFLHSYLIDRLKGRLKAKVSDPPDRILRETRALEQKLNSAEEAEIVRRFVAELEKGGRAVSGIKETLRKLNMVEVQALLVSHNFTAEGKVCPRCEFLYVAEDVCPTCQIKTQAVLDVVDEAIGAAVNQQAEVRQITPPSKLDHYGKIGAFLRFKA
jgi:hypothetical protein